MSAHIEDIKLSNRIERLRPFILNDKTCPINIVKICIWNIHFLEDGVQQFICSGILDISTDFICYQLGLKKLLQLCRGSLLNLTLNLPCDPSTFHCNVYGKEYVYKPTNKVKRWTELEHLIEIVKNGDSSIAKQKLTKINHADHMLHIHDMRI